MPEFDTNFASLCTTRILDAVIVPRHRFMAAYEQHVEAPDRRWQYIMFAAEPYETIAFKIPSREVDKGLAGLKNPAPSVPERPATLDNLNLDVTSTGFWSFWNRDTKQLFVQIPFKLQQDPRALQIMKVCNNSSSRPLLSSSFPSFFPSSSFETSRSLCSLRRTCNLSARRRPPHSARSPCRRRLQICLAISRAMAARASREVRRRLHRRALVLRCRR